jgi:hypothetical protein
MPTSFSSAEGVRRAFDTLLRNGPGRSVMLRIHAPATPGDATEQLGLAVPQFQDVELAPVVFRKTSARATAGKAAERDLLVSATSVQALTSSHNFGSAAEVFASAFGVLVDDALLAIASANELESGGQVCGYRLALRETSAATVLN